MCKTVGTLWREKNSPMGNGWYCVQPGHPSGTDQQRGKRCRVPLDGMWQQRPQLPRGRTAARAWHGLQMWQQHPQRPGDGQSGPGIQETSRAKIRQRVRI